MLFTLFSASAKWGIKSQWSRAFVYNTETEIRDRFISFGSFVFSAESARYHKGVIARQGERLQMY
jgi:hypothetical protein